MVYWKSLAQISIQEIHPNWVTSSAQRNVMLTEALRTVSQEVLYQHLHEPLNNMSMLETVVTILEDFFVLLIDLRKQSYMLAVFQ